MWTAFAAVVICLSCAARDTAADADNVRVSPAPAGEVLSADYAVTVDARSIPVYVAKVAPADATRRWKAMDDKVNSADYFDKASFAYFDMRGQVTVTVACPEATDGVFPATIPLATDRAP